MLNILQKSEIHTVVGTPALTASTPPASTHHWITSGEKIAVRSSLLLSCRIHPSPPHPLHHRPSFRSHYSSRPAISNNLHEEELCRDRDFFFFSFLLGFILLDNQESANVWCCSLWKHKAATLLWANLWCHGSAGWHYFFFLKTQQIQWAWHTVLYRTAYD